MVPPVGRRATRASDAPREEPAWILAGRAFVRGRLQPVEIAIGPDGRIQSIGRVRSGAPRTDVGDRVILPAATDVHVHAREPGPESGIENLATATVEAALGGVGLVGEMPNTTPPVTDPETLEEKAALVPGRAAVDVLLYASPARPARRAALARRAGAFKLYLAPTTGIPDPPALASVPGLLERLAPLGLPVSVHAEDPGAFHDGRRPGDLAEWNAHRPPAAETAAIGALVARAPASLRLHVAHVTEASSAARLRAAGVSFEATPHHLLLSDRSRVGTAGKVNPPLRSEADRAALWAMFARGEVPILASDHAPHARSEKDRPFADAPSGLPGLETMLPLLLARVRTGDLALAVLVAAAADRPARWFGQPLGRIAPGHRANLLVVDFKVRTTIEARRLRSPCGWTPFEGGDAIFPQLHYRDGEAIVRDGEYVGTPTGRVVRPEFAPGEPLGPSAG
ncbi:MAG TPA: amidohydrolase family protein [Thermoplasmata archaeon]|jgi:dihydroorotase|nr:amidohydrolase family protein [Thermoplasmata archaeon]